MMALLFFVVSPSQNLALQDAPLLLLAFYQKATLSRAKTLSSRQLLPEVLHVYIYTHTRTYTGTHMHPHAHTHTHTHTHMHILTLSLHNNITQISYKFTQLIDNN